jgi:hypothetical protein
MAERDLNQEIEEGVEAFQTAMAGLGITLSDEEIEAKRKELRYQLGGEGGELAVLEGGEVTSWEEAERAFQQSPDSFTILDDFVKLDLKEQLVNIPFVISSCWFSLGDQGDYVTMKCVVSRPIMTPTGPTQKVVVTDGSTGIYQQIRKLVTSTGQTKNIMVRNGLRVSRYTVDTEEGEKNAETFYLN